MTRFGAAEAGRELEEALQARRVRQDGSRSMSGYSGGHMHGRAGRRGLFVNIDAKVFEGWSQNMC